MSPPPQPALSLPAYLQNKMLSNNSPTSSRRPVMSTRFNTLVAILSFSLITLILGICFAAEQASFSSSNHNSTSSRNSTIHLVPIVSLYGHIVNRGVFPLPMDPNPYGSRNRSNSSDQDDLFFYTVTLPTLSMIHASTEGYLAPYKPSALASRNSQFTTITVGIVYTVGWVINNAFWLQCDLSPQNFCPVQPRQHIFGYAYKVATAKDVFAWLISGLYLVQIGAIGWSMRTERKQGRLGLEKKAVASVDDALSANTVTCRED